MLHDESLSREIWFVSGQTQGVDQTRSTDSLTQERVSDPTELRSVPFGGVPVWQWLQRCGRRRALDSLNDGLETVFDNWVPKAEAIGTFQCEDVVGGGSGWEGTYGSDGFY